MNFEKNGLLSAPASIILSCAKAGPMVKGHSSTIYRPWHIAFCVQLYLTAGAALVSTITSLTTLKRSVGGAFDWREGK